VTICVRSNAPIYERRDYMSRFRAGQAARLQSPCWCMNVSSRPFVTISL
jgi:hypothetical protein